MIKITDPFEPLVPEKYDAVTDCEYDSAGNMLFAKFRHAGVVLSTLTMTYDAAGNMTSAVRS